MDRLASLLLDFRARCVAFSAIHLAGLSAEIVTEATSRDLPIPFQLETTDAACCLQYTYPDGVGATRLLWAGRTVPAVFETDGGRWEGMATVDKKSHITRAELDRVVGAVVDSWLLSLGAAATGATNAPNVVGDQKTGYLTCGDLAEKHGVDPEQLRQRLIRFRRDNLSGFTENENRRQNEPQYLFDESAVMSIIESLKSKTD